MTSILYKEESFLIQGAIFEVYKELGPSFLESVYYDCLSSLDNLITAQAQKIEALKLHKKGLMQGLFPSLEEVDA